MAINSLSAAKKLCELSNWQLSNLVVQKILYISHMIHLGKYREPLVDELFEAWDYGPVLPTVYQRSKPFGAGPVMNVFRGVRDAPDGTEVEILTEAAEKLGASKPSALVAMTHWEGGAWAEYYNPGTKGIVIPNDAIREEYGKRFNGR